MRLLSILLTFLFLHTVYGQGIVFEDLAWRKALAKAKEENKLLFVDAYAKWCGPCKVMAKKEFTKEDVGSFFNEKFVNLKLDMETKDGRTFDAQYPVSAYPTMFFIDGNGNVIERIKGARKGDGLIAAGNAALSRVNLAASYEEAYAKGDRDYDLIYNYVKTLNTGNKPSLKISNDFLKGNPKMTEEQRRRFIHEAAVEADSRIYTMMMDDKSAIRKLVGEEAFVKKVKTACNATISKALEYQEPFLLEEAMDAAKKGLSGDDEEEFIVLGHLSYASQMQDADMYHKYTSKAKKVFKKETKQLNNIVTQIQRYFPNNAKLLKEAVDLSKVIYQKEVTLKNLECYAGLLVETDKRSKAIKVLEKASDTGLFKAQEKQRITKMIDIIKKEL